MTDTHDLSYSADTDDSGNYGRTLPAATYDITVSAYGYLPATVTNVPLTTGGLTQDFVLQAAPPVTPQVSISTDGDLTQLTWMNVPPNMTYTAYRGENPYFAPAANYPQRIGKCRSPTRSYTTSWRGSSNRFYAVVAHNAAGAGAPASRVGIFQFDLQPGE